MFGVQGLLLGGLLTLPDTLNMVLSLGARTIGDCTKMVHMDAYNVGAVVAGPLVACVTHSCLQCCILCGGVVRQGLELAAPLLHQQRR